MKHSISQPYVYNGIIYSVLFGGIGLYIITQIVAYFMGFKDTTRKHSKRKFWFHVLMLIYATLESVFAISLIVSNSYTRFGYFVHVIALYIHLVLFGISVNFWKQTMHNVFPSRRKLGAFVLGSNGVVTLIAVISIACKCLRVV